MTFGQIHQLFSFKNLFKLVLGMAVVIQLFVITYNHFSGYHELNSFNELILRVIRGIIYSTIAGFAIAYPDLFVIQYLNKKLHWNYGVLKRVSIQFILMLIIAVIVSSLLTFFAHWVSNYRQGLLNVLINNMLIYSVVNAFFMSILEAWIYLDDSLKEKARAEKLQQELVIEASNRAMYQAQIQIEEEKNKFAQKLIEQEKQLNQHLEEEIKKRELITRELNESREHIKELMDLLPQPIFELDIQGNILFLNRSGEEFFGITIPDDPNVKVSALAYMVEADVPRVIENIKQSNLGIFTNPNEYTVKRPDGTLCPVLIYGSPIIRDNKVIGRRGIIIDISERKKQEQKLLNAKEELERINDTLELSVAERTKQLTEANTQLLKVQKENLQSQFEVLKQQVNPHFLFNSLNVLTSLIKIDPDLAESFTERLSKVYRYVLENKEKDLVSLTTELEFLNAYLFLLEIRFMKKLFIEIRIDKSYYDYQILPIAIQLIIENAIKHNTFSKVQPLKIEIFVDDQERLNIINNLNLRETKLVSTRVGLENINRRYALVSDQKPEFIKTNEHFIAKLPLLRAEKFETE